MFTNKNPNEFDPLYEYKKVAITRQHKKVLHPKKHNEQLEIDDFVEYINTSTKLINDNMSEINIQTNNSLYIIAKNGLKYANDINNKK